VYRDGNPTGAFPGKAFVNGAKQVFDSKNIWFTQPSPGAT
jgi:hypothetical protein